MDILIELWGYQTDYGASSLNLWCCMGP